MQLFSKGNHGEPFHSKKSHRPVPSKIKLFSFLIAFILLWPAFLAASVTDQATSQEDERRARTVYFIPTIVEIEPGGSADAALKIYQEWKQGAAKGAKVPEATMVEIYKAAGGDNKAFKNIAYLIQGGKITPEHSVDMAEHRERWIEEIIMEIGRDQKWLIGRSDSGNTTSGMKSDLDQTIYVYERSSDGKKFFRVETLDKEFIDLFDQKWQAKHPEVSLGALDIASIEGKNRFPDPRDTKIEFSSTFRGTIEQLRNTPGAYTYQGAVVQQMQLRALNEIIKGNPRSFQRYGPSGKMGKWKKLPFDGEEAMRTMFGIEPELMPAHALGAALANFLELQHYMGAKKFETKYHLRTWEDAMLVLSLAEKGLGKNRKLEYTDLDGDQRTLMNEEIMKRLFPDDPTKQKLHEMALNISADLRLLHKNKLDEIESFKGHSEEALKSLEFQEELIFKKLAQEIFKTKNDKIDPENPDRQHEDDKFNPENPDRQHIEMAIKEQRKLASEFCLESIYQSSKEAFKLLMDSKTGDPFKMDQYWHLTKLANDPKSAKIKKNLKEAAHLTFLYGLYDLGAAKSYSLLKRLKQEFPTSNLNLFGLWLRGRLQGIEGMMRTPDIYLNIYGNRLRENYLQLSERVQIHILSEIGFENVEQAKQVGEFLEKHHLSWRPGKLIRNMANDPGNIDALAQILRAYVESGGDNNKAAQAAVDEIIMAIPVFGQIVAASRTDLPGLFLMGAAMYSPVGAGILVVHSVGQAGYAIYDLEYAQPMAGNTANGIYRGYIGPETRFYGTAPEQFNDDDRKRLAELQAQLLEAYGKVPAWHGDTDRRMREWSPGIPPAIARARAEYEILANQLRPEIEFLQRKKKISKAFDDDVAYGGRIYGAGAQLEQKLFENYILKDLKPIISFSPAGIIDFRSDYDPATDEARLEQLITKIKEATNFEAALKPMEEYQELSLQMLRFERAQRYLLRATGRSENTEGMTEVEARLHSQALMHKLQRDSLYPWLKEKGYTNTEEFINDWVKANEKAVIEELVKNNLLSTYVQPRSSRIFEGDQAPIMPTSIPEKALTRLKEQMYQDYMKSADLYQDFLKTEKLRKKKNKIRQKNRIDAYRAEAAGLFVQQIRDNPEMKGQMEEMLMALRLAAIKRNPPEIEATVYHKSQKKAPTEDAQDSSEEEEHEFTVSVKIQADPTLYHPPYFKEVYLLNKKDAQGAVNSKKIKEVPLSQNIVDQLKRALKKSASNSKDDEVMMVVVNVFAAGMPDLEDAIPATIEDLPRIKTGAGYLMGQSMAYAALPEKEEEPIVAKADDKIKVKMKAKKDRFSYEWQDLTEENAHAWTKNKPHVWLRWPDMPDKKFYEARIKVTGGFPPFEKEWQGLVFRGQGFEDTYEEGKPKNAYIVEIPLEPGHVGPFKVEGALLAYDLPQHKRRNREVKPFATYPFTTSFKYFGPKRVTNGRVTGYVGNNYQFVLSANLSCLGCQPGNRIARVDIGGQTLYGLFSGAVQIKLPVSSGIPGSAQMTFVDFGEEITLDVPLENKTRPQKWYLSQKTIKMYNERIAEYMKKSEEAFLYRIAQEYANLAQYFRKPSAVFDKGQWIDFTNKLINYSDRAVQASKSESWDGYKKYGIPSSVTMYNISTVSDPVEKAKLMKKVRLTIASHTYIWLQGEIHAAIRFGELELAKQWIEAIVKFYNTMVEDPRYIQDVYRMTSIYQNLARAEFARTGNLNSAQKYWLQAYEWERKRDPQYKIRPFPIVPDPKFNVKRTAER